MNEQMTIPANEMPFKEFLLKNKRNRTILWMAGIAILIQFCILKYFYPFASYIHGDSFSYLRAAYYNFDINTYMVGYSRFLRLFSVFTTSDMVLTGFQYLFIQSSSLFLLSTLFYFYNPGKAVQLALVGFMVLNPLFLYLANLVSSDCFFASLSMVWFALLLWFINKPSIKVLIWHTIFLLLAFTVRYNALIYPFISCGVILFSQLQWRKKVASIGASMLLCGLFVTYTSYEYKELTGVWQYSPFSGWQMANNAMYAYRYVEPKKRKPVPKRFEVLDKMIREYFDSTRNRKIFWTEGVKAGTYYMWSPGMPLVQYRNKLFKGDTVSSELKKWASVAPFFKEYGTHIIKNYPTYFAQYFLWPNANKYYAPPVEFLQTYNSGSDSVALIAKVWFNYETTKVKTRTKDPEIALLNYYPILSGIINVIMLFGIIAFAALKGFKKGVQIRSAIILGGTIWLLNALFTIGASSVALRFQSFPIIISTIFSFLLFDWLWMMASDKKNIKNESAAVEALPTNIHGKTAISAVN